MINSILNKRDDSELIALVNKMFSERSEHSYIKLRVTYTEKGIKCVVPGVASTAFDVHANYNLVQYNDKNYYKVPCNCPFISNRILAGVSKISYGNGMIETVDPIVEQFVYLMEKDILDDIRSVLLEIEKGIVCK